MKNPFSTTGGIIAAGVVIGLGAAILQKLGNPGNMGICVACFGRDVVGAVGLHRADTVQYARPEIFALVIGAFVAAISSGEFKPRSGASPVARFFLGAAVAVGALIFLGCPWRALLRLAGGDLNAIAGILGLVVGVVIASRFNKNKFTLGAAKPSNAILGLGFVLFMVALLIIRLAYPPIAGEAKNDLLFYSISGPGSLHAPLWASLLIALVIGFVGQRSRFCSIGAFQDVLLFKSWHLFLGVVAFVVAAFAANLAFGQFHLGIDGQPIAHKLQLWNFMGLVVVGLGSALGGGCPGRQLFLAGEGDGDAAVFVLGLLAGLAMAHNWQLASSPAGLGAHGATAGILSVVVILVIGLAGLKKSPAVA
ncbi:MAG: YedE-related selenium metabolism membrane protein [Deltaproteobacteria bacterium]|jgi:YedE family putative selenium metabolism protein|nr:YedE-related selenium metabolism membrane protein [Deltaproteobacteria bacterium]